MCVSSDVAVMNEDGYVKIVGRAKDMVIRGGENIYPTEVEDFLMTHPDVLEASAFGVPDDRMGEELAVWIRLRRPDSVSEHDIRSYCKGRVLSDKASLVQQLERRAAEVARLTAALEDWGAELAAANAAKCRALAQVGEIAAKEISFQYRERKMASEKEVLEKQMSLLLESLKSQAEELSTLRRQHSSRILQLQADLASKMDQLGTEQAEKERLTQQAADLEQRLTELVEKPRLQREAEIEQEKNYQQQLRSQERLAQPYKEGVEKAEARSNEMLRSVDELRSLLSSASEQQSQLEVHLDETHTQHGQYLVERDKVILQLRDRLETYEEQLQAITRR
ncbi:putative acyl-CoA synthetase YngI [Amphibalanus amphitrite]|uniref:Putative acyl-CoA synthetase YngI n=1 Tax=Amphibalanus amphitrite TaxID=1232801 RepID=A0A6A4VEC6_AMPAM|nr:putative acyl-CoA synthetase YngI [Amphibalanus amphitrite]